MVAIIFRHTGFDEGRIDRDRFRATGHRADAFLDRLNDAKRLHEAEEALDFLGWAGHFDDHAAAGDVNQFPFVGLAEQQYFSADRAGSGDLNQRQIAQDGLADGDIIDPQHVDQLVEVGFHSGDADFISIDHDGHTGNAFGLGTAYGEGIDVEGTPAKERYHPVQHTGLIFDVGD